MARILLLALACLASFATNADAAGKLEIFDAWIREAPPGAAMLAGYARLRNDGDAPVTVRSAHSDAFGNVSLHETIDADGVERMRPIAQLTIAPGASVVLAPGGKHLMLMHPTRPLGAGASATIHFDTGADGGADATFVVRDAPPGDD